MSHLTIIYDIYNKITFNFNFIPISMEPDDNLEILDYTNITLLIEPDDY